MLESFKRYYHNSFLDNQRQEAYNLFLGNYIYAQGQPMLWELPSDYYLHHADPSKKAKEVSVNGKSGGKTRRHYIRWFTPAFLEKRSLPPLPDPSPKTKGDNTDAQKSIMDSDWWQEFHRLPILSSFNRNFAYKMNSTERYLPKARSTKFDMSPFSVRRPSGDGDHGTDRTAARGSSTNNPAKDKKGMDRYQGISDPHSREVINPLSATSPPKQVDRRISSLQKWLHPHESEPEDPANPKSTQQRQSSRAPAPYGSRRSGQHQRTNSPDTTTNPAASTGAPPQSGAVGGSKPSTTQTTLAQIHANSLNPSVSKTEQAAYERYLQRPLEMYPEFAGSKIATENGVVEAKDIAATCAAGASSRRKEDGDETKRARTGTAGTVSMAPPGERSATPTARTGTPPVRPPQPQPQQPQQTQPQAQPAPSSDPALFREYSIHIARGTLPTPETPPAPEAVAPRGKDGLPEVPTTAVREYIAWVLQYEGSAGPSGSSAIPSSMSSTSVPGTAQPQWTGERAATVPAKIDPFGPLDVRPADLEKKRYQAYDKWTRGKSIFKLSKVDPEFRDAGSGGAVGGGGTATAAAGLGGPGGGVGVGVGSAR